MRRSRTTARLLTAAAVLGLIGLGSGCGDDDSPDEGAAPSEAGATADCETNPGEEVAVDIGDFVFDPTPVEIGVCDSVVWTNAHDQAHTATGNGAQSWNTGNLAPGDASEPVPFESAGDFAYVCALHPFMTGTVTAS